MDGTTYVEREKALLEKFEALVKEAIELFFTDPSAADYRLEAIGILISKAARWDFANLIEIVLAAFQDSNFEDFIEEIEGLLIEEE
jgi:hypothetical protein